MLYEDSAQMVEYMQQALKQATHEAIVLHYSPGIDPFLEDLARVLIESTSRKGQRETPRLTAKA
jgi:hypothetical protein